MDIIYTSIYHRTAFRNIKPGEMFRDKDCKGLFIRLPEGSAAPVMIIDPLPIREAIDKGNISSWNDDDDVYPVKTITIALHPIRS